MLACAAVPCMGGACENAPMSKAAKWILVAALLLVLLLAGALFGLSRWAASDDFRVRAQDMASRALGLPVQLGRIDVTLWPLPAVAVHDVRVQTRPALTLQRVEAQPVWSALLAGRPELDALVVRNAELPQQGLVALAAAAQKQDPPGGKPAAASSPSLPRRIVLDRVTWMDAKGQPLTVDAEIAFAGEPLPQAARVAVVDGRFKGAKARLERQADAWRLHADIGGGTVQGPLKLQPARGGGSRLTGELATSQVEVAALTAPSRTLTGRLEARTSLQADFKEPSELADVLRSQTRFTVRQAVIHGIDLAQAVRTLGASRSGTTALDTLTGQVATQGRVIQLSNLVANSGALSATGNVNVAADRSLRGRVHVALTAGAVGTIAGVPLQGAGTLDAPSATPAGVTLPGSAAAADLGDKLGKGIKGLFGLSLDHKSRRQLCSV